MRQKGDDKKATLKRVALVPNLKRDRFSAKIALETLGRTMPFIPDTVCLEKGDNSIKFHTSRSGLHATEARRMPTKIAALTAQSSLQ